MSKKKEEEKKTNQPKPNHSYDDGDAHIRLQLSTLEMRDTENKSYKKYHIRNMIMMMINGMNVVHKHEYICDIYRCMCKCVFSPLAWMKLHSINSLSLSFYSDKIISYVWKLRSFFFLSKIIGKYFFVKWMRWELTNQSTLSVILIVYFVCRFGFWRKNKVFSLKIKRHRKTKWKRTKKANEQSGTQSRMKTKHTHTHGIINRIPWYACVLFFAFMCAAAQKRNVSLFLIFFSRSVYSAFCTHFF